MSDALENKYRILALKKATLVMNGLADSFKDEHTKQETKSLAWAIQWAVSRLEEIETAKVKEEEANDGRTAG